MKKLLIEGILLAVGSVELGAELLHVLANIQRPSVEHEFHKLQFLIAFGFWAILQYSKANDEPV